MKSMHDLLSGIERRLRARAIPVVRAVGNPPAGYAALWVDQMTGKLRMKRSDGTTTTYSAGGGGSSGPATSIRETSGPTTLTVGAIADGQVFQRVGSTVVGAWALAFALTWDGNTYESGPAPVEYSAGTSWA